MTDLVEEPTLDDFLSGYLKPMVDRYEKDVMRLRSELCQAEAQLSDLLTTQKVLRDRARPTRLQRELGNQPRVRMCLPGEE